MKNLFLLSMLLFSLFAEGQTIIPSPAKIVLNGDSLILESKIKVYAEINYPVLMSILSEEIFLDFKINTTNSHKKADIVFKKKSELSKEAYEVSITDNKIIVSAADNAGFLYAVQSLRQVINRRGDGSIAIASMDIEDSPRQRFRSLMLDSGRQYQKVSTLKKYIDMLAMLKMNYFHWHLTEGLGWRIEIKKYPQLTALGSKVGKGQEQQGYYTHEDIKEVVKYAADRCITVIPEIDMPGHAEAALFSYPSLGCFNQKVVVPENGFTQHIFCAGKDATLVFLKDVLDEVCELFPSEYIHIGGDEAPKGNWNKCPDCQNRIKELKLSSSHQLQLWFTAEMANHLATKGRKAVCWGDVVYHAGYPLPDNVVIHWWNWRGHKDKAYQEALKNGLEVICGTNYYNYLNFPVTPWSGYLKARTFDMEDIYLKNPSYYNVDATSKLVLGMSTALWTDGGVLESMLDRRLFPRIFANVEQMWYKGTLKPFDVFKKIVDDKQKWFESQGYIYGPSLLEETPVDYKWD